MTPLQARLGLTRRVWVRLTIETLVEALPLLPWWQRAPVVLGILTKLTWDLLRWKTRGPELAAEIGSVDR